ncbi:MAG: hypothetical protein ABW098_15385 [Candidatus Thiodiazotropha sp.]
MRVSFSPRLIVPMYADDLARDVGEKSLQAVLFPAPSQLIR